MHPHIELDHEGECPICGMTLVKKIVEENKADSELGESKNQFSISEDKQKLIGVETIEVKKGDIKKVLSFSGRVAYDPDLYSVLTEYQVAKRLGNSGDSLIQKSAKLRLVKFGLSENQIQFINRRSPEIFLTGRYGSKVLILIQVYEADSQISKIGSKMEIRADSFPSKVFNGEIVAIGNLVDETTRTISVWCEVNDPESLLKPQMFVESLATMLRKNILRIPKDSVFPTGKRSLVYVKINDSSFSPKEITEGFSSSDWVEVLDGLSEGDFIVSKANFLLDSEAKLKLGENNDSNHN
jgi:Cu(I)/Ag(I) efflux system membrane fusion protein